MVRLSCRSWLIVMLLFASVVFRAYGASLDFDGVDDYVEMGTMSLSLPVTVELWFKTNVVNHQWDCLFAWSQEGPWSGIIVYAVGDGRIGVRMAADGDNDWRGGGSIVGDNNWHHVAATRGLDNTIRVYIDGVFQSTSTVSTGIGATHNLRLGKPNGYDGQVSGVRIWNVVRTAEEIAVDADPCAVYTGAESNLVGSWNLDEGSGQVVDDATAGNHNGTLGSSSGVDSADPVWTSNSRCPGGNLHTLITPPEAITAGAQWRRLGTTAWFNSGDTELNIPLGEHSVEFKPVPGWSATNQTVAITYGTTTECLGTYTYLGDGNLQVIIEPPEAVAAGAQWRRLGTATWFNSGDIETDIPAFEYEMEFKPVTGWAAPDSHTVDVPAGSTANDIGTYVVWGNLCVTLGPPQAVIAGGQWRRLNTTAWLNSGDSETLLPPGDYEVEFKAISGWLAPANHTVNVPAGTTTNDTGVYTDSAGPSSTCRDETWGPNGPVRAIVTTPTTTYIGGDFTYVMPYPGTWVSIDRTTGRLSGPFPKVYGKVRTCVSDGSGGWYIGGDFTKVQTTTRNYIAHILSDGTLDPLWNPNANGTVCCLAMSNDASKLYIGGKFTSIGGQVRNHYAALDTTSGLVTEWNPNVNTVDEFYASFCLAVADTTVYIGGTFNSVGGQSRRHIAAVDPLTGTPTAWNPLANSYGYVFALAVSGTTVYAGGNFTSIGGQTRNRVAALDANTGLATPWDPNVNGTVYALVVSGTTIYIAGGFSVVGNQTRNNIAALDTTLNTNNATDWIPNANGGVAALVLSGSTLYVAGGFTTIGLQTRNRIAALDIATGLATDWNPNADKSVLALGISETSVYAGGEFNTICWLPRNRLAAIDVGTGVATNWNPDANSTVKTLAVSGATIYAGGYFTNVGGQTRNRIAAIDSGTGLVTAWNPNSNGTVWDVIASGTSVYVGGEFTSIGGQTRKKIAELNTGTGLATAWNPDTGYDNSFVRALVLSPDCTIIYAGGLFNYVGGQTRTNIAALYTAMNTNNATAWNPIANNDILSLEVSEDGGTVYAAGWFSSIGGQVRTTMAGIDTATGLATAFNPSVICYEEDLWSPECWALALSDTGLYAGGYFTSVANQSRKGLVALDTTMGLPTSWNPSEDTTSSGVRIRVEALAVSGTTVYAGGEFLDFGGLSRPYFAEFNASTAPYNPRATNIGTETITWTWQENSSDVTGFNVYVDPGSQTPTTLRTTTSFDTTVWQHDGLSANTQYAFQVAALIGLEDVGRTGVRTAYTLIEPVSGLTFSSVGPNTIGVASTNLPSNLENGCSGLIYTNTNTSASSGWLKNNDPWISTGLTPNTEYLFNGKTRNCESVETTASQASKYTLSATPVAPEVGLPSLHSAGVDTLDVAVGAGDGNPLYTLYAIHVSPSVDGSTWVQADGTVGADPVFRMAATWDVHRVTGLSKDTLYTFSIVARNGENVNTAAGPSASARTYPNVPPSTPTVAFPDVQSDTANLFCVISMGGYDPDGDPVLYEFNWYMKRGEDDFVLAVDGVPQPAMSSQVNSEATEPGDIWYCVVTPHDMLEAGIPTTTGECSIVLGGVIPSFISLAASPLAVTLGQSVMVSGQIFPMPSGSGTVTFESTSPSGVMSNTFPEGTVFSAGVYLKTFYPTEASEGRSAWSLTATWPGDATHQSATSTPVSLTVPKAQPELALSLSYSSALLNLAGAEDFEVAAALAVSGFPAELQSLLSGRTVRLSVQTPDGQTPWAPLEAVTDAAGVAHFDKAAFEAAGVTFNEAGVWRFRAAFDGNENLRSAVTEDFGSTTARLTIKEGAGYVILALGRLDAFAEGHAEHGQTTDYIYSVLRGRGFVDDDIQYLREFLPGEIDRGFPVDGTATAASLQFAIETWARDKMLASPAPLYVVLVDHGNPGIIYTDIASTGPVEVITAGDLNGWVSVLQSALGGKMAEMQNTPGELLFAEKEVPPDPFKKNEMGTGHSPVSLPGAATLGPESGDSPASLLGVVSLGPESGDSPVSLPAVAPLGQSPFSLGQSPVSKATAAEQDITVIYGACYSGSFIPVLSGPGRVIITSSAANEIAYRGVINEETGLRDGDFFLTEFFRNAGEGRTLKDAFELACAKTSEYTATRTGSNAVVPQHPLLDDNADGVGTTGYLSPVPGLDGALVAGMDLGLGANAGNGIGWFTAMPPVNLTPGGTLPDGLWAEATGRALLPGDAAWLEIKTPAYNDGTVATAGYEAFQRVASLVGPIHVAATPEDLGGGRTRFSWSHADITAQLTGGFATPGTYKAYYFLRDGETGQVGAYLVTNIYISQAGNQPPAAVDLLYPDHDGTVNATFFLAWTESIDPNADPVTYRVEVSEDPLFPEADTIVRDGLTDTVVTLSTADGILNDHDYYWRVIPTDPYGATPEDNDTRRFLVRGSPGVPGAITGKVTVEGTAVGVNGAVLTLTPTAVQAQSIPPNGAYFLEASQGVYNLSISAPGYQPEQVNGVIVTSGRYTTLQVALTPQAINHAPVWTAIGDKWVVANRTLTFQVFATDIDAGQILTYSVSGLPAGAAFDPATRTFTWTPATGQVRTGPYTITFTATDNGEPVLAAAITIGITVDRGAYISGPGMAVIGDRVELEYHGVYQPGLWHVEWQHEGTILSDQNDELLVIESVSPDDAGWYTATQISEDGKAEPVSASFYLNVYEAMPLRWGMALAAFVCLALVAAGRVGPVGRVGRGRLGKG